MAHEEKPARALGERRSQALYGGKVEMVCRLVHDNQVGDARDSDREHHLVGALSAVNARENVL